MTTVDGRRQPSPRERRTQRTELELERVRPRRPHRARGDHRSGSRRRPERRRGYEPIRKRAASASARGRRTRGRGRRSSTIASARVVSPRGGGSNPSAMTRRAVGGGDGAAVGASATSSQVSRMRRSARQSADKERAMLDQLSALRRAKERGENRVKDLARELRGERVDSREWTRRNAAWLPAWRANRRRRRRRGRPRRGQGAAALARRFGLDDDVASDSGSESGRRGGGTPRVSKNSHGRVDEAAAMATASGAARVSTPTFAIGSETPRSSSPRRITVNASRRCAFASTPTWSAVEQRRAALLLRVLALRARGHLVSKGADPEIRNADGQTPRETLTRRRCARWRRRETSGAATARIRDGGARGIARKSGGRERDGRVGIGSDGGGLDSYRALYDSDDEGVPDVRVA